MSLIHILRLEWKKRQNYIKFSLGVLSIHCKRNLFVIKLDIKIIFRLFICTNNLETLRTWWLHRNQRKALPGVFKNKTALRWCMLATAAIQQIPFEICVIFFVYRLVIGLDSINFGSHQYIHIFLTTYHYKYSLKFATRKIQEFPSSEVIKNVWWDLLNWKSYRAIKSNMGTK